MIKPYFAHFDLDSFFVSVETILNPDLAGKAVIVGGSATRGVVSTCSYEARKYGVKSAMPMATALKLCPHALVVKSTRGAYSKFSAWVTQIIAQHVPAFEKAGADEFYIDLTGMDKFFNPLQFCIDLREKIILETKLPISFGLASNKLIAKMASDEAKPNGYLYIKHGFEKQFLHPLPIEKMRGVGESTAQKLKKMGIHRIGDVAKIAPTVLQQKLGQWGVELAKKCNGEVVSSLRVHEDSKSISTEHTFDQDTSDNIFLYAQLMGMVEKVMQQLREENLYCASLTLKLKYADFTTKTRQVSIPATQIDDEVIPHIRQLFTEHVEPNMSLRLIGVKLGNLMSSHFLQGNLFSSTQQKTKLYQSIDELKRKFGKEVIVKANSQIKSHN